MTEELDQQPVETTDEAQVEEVQEDTEVEEPEEGADTEPEMAFSWEASEYVHNHKSTMWYGVLGLIVAALSGLAILLHLWLEIGVFIAMGGALAVYAQKPPRVMRYELSDQGVHIDGALYPFGDFRSFGVIPDEEWHSIDLEPTKRFSPRRVILFDTEDFDEIVGHLELHLPREDRPLDIIERITRYVRF